MNRPAKQSELKKNGRKVRKTSREKSFCQCGDSQQMVCTFSYVPRFLSLLLFSQLQK